MHNATIEKKKSYFQERIFNQLGLSESEIIQSLPMFQAGVPDPDYSRLFPYFEEDEKGIRINYPSLLGSQYVYGKNISTQSENGTKWGKHFFRIRFEKPFVNSVTGKTQKYWQPEKSSIFPFITPGVLSKFFKKEPITTLVLIEGEFKAFKAWSVKSKIEGFDSLEFLGIPSYNGFKGGGLSGSEIHKDILRIIIECNVQNVVFMTDADTFLVKWEKDKDLSLRLKLFKSAVSTFREEISIQVEEKRISKVYFMALQPGFNEVTKGLDDLLVAKPMKAKEIFSELLRFSQGFEYFKTVDITENQFTKSLDKEFGLNHVDNFYKKYEDSIGDKQFIFWSIRYEKQGDSLKKIGHKDAEQYVRIGCDYFKISMSINKRGIEEQQILKWKKSEITQDYKRHKTFIDEISKFDKMNVLPAWMPGTYNRVINGSEFNMMDPLSYDLIPGKFDYTIEFLKHIFRGNAEIKWNEKTSGYEENNILGDPFSIILDYLTIQFRYPTHILPVPILVSEENETGKSTFLNWLNMVYGNNAIVMSMERIKDQFNAHYASKYIIGLDEGQIDIESKKDKEKLKQLATAITIPIEFKGGDVRPLDYYGKLIVCSNFANSVIKIEEGENRWFVVKVPVIEKRIEKLEEKLFKEIPYWLEYISNREIFHPDEKRFWFDDKYIKTEQYYKIIKNTKNRFEDNFERWIKNIFLKYRVEKFEFQTEDIMQKIKESGYFKFSPDIATIENFLEEKKSMKRSKTKRYTYPVGFEVDPSTGEDDDSKVKLLHPKPFGRVFTFSSSDWLNEEDLKDFKQSENNELPF